MNLPDISYKILYVVRGYIRLEVPVLKKLPWSFFYKNPRKSLFPVPSGIKNFHLNPFNGSAVIIYEPRTIDILEYIKSMASDKDIKQIIKDK